MKGTLDFVRGSTTGAKVKSLILLATLEITSSLVPPFARAQTVVATVSVGTNLTGVAYDSVKGEVFLE